MARYHFRWVYASERCLWSIGTQKDHNPEPSGLLDWSEQSALAMLSKLDVVPISQFSG